MGPTIFGFEGQQGGCNHYRLYQPLAKIMERELLPCALSSMLGPDDMSEWTDKCDILMTMRATLESTYKYMKFMRETKDHKKFIIDYDDNLFAVSPYNPSYRSFGLQEVAITTADGKTVQIKDGENGFDIEANKKRLACFIGCLEMADMVTTPSPVLSGVFKRFNTNTRVLKNLVNLEVWDPIHMVKDEFVRIVYQGGWSHFEDWMTIHGVLKVLMQEHKNLKLIVMGQSYEGSLKELPQDRVEQVPWHDLAIYPWKLKTLNADIGIAPLENNIFNTCKSELKWEEYSALEIPTVASNIPPYNLNIADGETGFLCSNEREWHQALTDLIERQELRVKIGKQARAHIVENYDLEKGAHDYVRLFQNLVRPRPLMEVV